MITSKGIEGGFDMKNFMLKLVTAILLLTLTFSLFACKPKDPQEENTTYSIQAPAQSEVYSVTGLPQSATKGATVSFKIVFTHPDDTILNSVTVKGTNTNLQLKASADGNYTFSMPSEPVSVTVDASYYPDNDSDNFLSWDSDNVTTVEKWQAAFEGDEYLDFADDFLLTTTITSQPSQSPANFALTSHTENAFSLNGDVVPDDAIKVEALYRDGNQANQFVLRIDRTKVSAGSAKIVLVVENGHKFGDKAVLACTVTVTEPEPLERVETWTATIVFDISAIQNDENTQKMAFVLEDLDYEQTMYLRPSQMFDIEDLQIVDGKVTVQFIYAKGHSYSVSFHYYMSTQPAYPTVEFDGEANGAEYAVNQLTFEKDGGWIHLTLK